MSLSFWINSQASLKVPTLFLRKNATIGKQVEQKLVSGKIGPVRFTAQTSESSKSVSSGGWKMFLEAYSCASNGLWFNAIVISSEVGYEKPAPQIFQTALDKLQVDASKAVHIGDDPQADKAGASAVGIDSWLWGKEVHTFQEISQRIVGSNAD